MLKLVQSIPNNFRFRRRYKATILKGLAQEVPHCFANTIAEYRFDDNYFVLNAPGATLDGTKSSTTESTGLYMAFQRISAASAGRGSWPLR
jgi:hypothetical protein